MSWPFTFTGLSGAELDGPPSLPPTQPPSNSTYTSTQTHKLTISFPLMMLWNDSRYENRCDYNQNDIIINTALFLSLWRRAKQCRGFFFFSIDWPGMLADVLCVIDSNWCCGLPEPHWDQYASQAGVLSTVHTHTHTHTRRQTDKQNTHCNEAIQYTERRIPKALRKKYTKKEEKWPMLHCCNNFWVKLNMLICGC